MTHRIHNPCHVIPWPHPVDKPHLLLGIRYVYVPDALASILVLPSHRTPFDQNGASFTKQDQQWLQGPRTGFGKGQNRE